MRVFVTGGTGFIGTHVIRELEAGGHELLLLALASEEVSPGNSGRINTVRGNLADISAWQDELKKFRPDVTLHMAWEGIPDYSSATSVKNLIYGLNLFKLLAEIECKRIICTGSCWEYGHQSGIVSEDESLKPSNAFSAAKNSLHWLGREIARENDIQFIWTRFFYVYGPGQRKGSLIPYIIDCARGGKKPEIKTPSARNDFIYVGDVAKAISAIVGKQPGSATYNIGSGYSTSVRQVIKIVHNELNLKYSEPDAPQNDSGVNFWADISKIKKDTGWKPQTGIKEGIKAMISYYIERDSDE